MKVRQANLRQAISGGRAVVAILGVEEDFVNLKDQYVNYSRSGGKLPSKTVTIFGYDEAKQLFEIAFPGGKNWGKGGTAYLRYADVDKIKLAFGFTLELPPIAKPKPVQLEPPVVVNNKKQENTTPKVKPTVRKPIQETIKPTNPSAATVTKKEQPTVAIINSSGTPTEVVEKPFVTSSEVEKQKSLTASVQLNDVRYNAYSELVRTPMPLTYAGTVVETRLAGLYQLQVSGMPAGSNVYILNIMPDTAKVHFPINSGVKTLGIQKISPYVTANSTEFYVPQPRLDAKTGAVIPCGFSMDTPHEYMVVLVAAEELDHKLPPLLSELTYHPDPQRFKQIVEQVVRQNNPALTLDSRNQTAIFAQNGTDILPIIISLTAN